MIKFSIITAVYNRRSTIFDSIESIKSQLYPLNLVERIIIDGGSTDGTFKIVNASLDNNSKLISEKDGGIYNALNKGYNLASGDVIGIMHSDDFYNDNLVLSDVNKLFSDESIDIVYGDLIYISNDIEMKTIRNWKSGKFSIKKLFWGWSPPHPTLFIRRKLYEKYGGYNELYRISSDYDFMLRYLSSSKKNVAYIPRVLVKMRIGGESNATLFKILKKMYEDYLAIKKNKIGGLLTLFSKNLIKIRQFF